MQINKLKADMYKNPKKCSKNTFKITTHFKIQQYGIIYILLLKNDYL